MINSLRYGVRLAKSIKGFSTVSAKDLTKTNKIAVDDAIKTGNLSAPLLDVPTMSIVRHPYLLNKELSENEEQHEVDTTIHSNRNIFSVVKFSGTQFKVTLDDVIVADKIEGIDIGDDIHVDEVLLVGSLSATLVGRPFVEGAKVTFSVEEITKDKKVIAFKMRRRKNSKRTKGFRRDVTILRVKDITLNDSSLKDELLR
eukprot:gene23287-31615_t